MSQRNALLKYFALNHVFEKDTLQIYNEQLHGLGNTIFEKRKEFLANFIPIFKQNMLKYFLENVAVSKTSVVILSESREVWYLIHKSIAQKPSIRHIYLDFFDGLDVLFGIIGVFSIGLLSEGK